MVQNKFFPYIRYMDKFRKYIRNILLEDLSGGYEHQNDEIVTFDKIDLKKEYDKLNALLFDNSLPNIKLDWDKRKGAHGSVHSMRNRYTGTQTIEGLYMSKFFKIPYWAFKNVLAHEMIHVKIISEGIIDHWSGKKSHHGFYFDKEMKRINSLGLGFKITVTGLGDELDHNAEVSDHIKEKNRNFCLLKIKKLYHLQGESEEVYGIVVFANSGNLSNTVDVINRVYEGSVDRGRYKSVEVTFGNSMNKNLLLFPVRRGLEKGKIISNVLKKNQYDSIISSMNVTSSSQFGNIEKKSQTEPVEKNIGFQDVIYKEPKQAIDPNSQEGKDALVAQFRKEQNRVFKEELYDIIQERNPQEKQRLYDEYVSNHGEFA